MQEKKSYDLLAEAIFSPFGPGKSFIFLPHFSLSRFWISLTSFLTKIEKASWVPWTRIWNTDFLASPNLLARIRPWPLCQSQPACFCIQWHCTHGKSAENNFCLTWKPSRKTKCIYSVAAPRNPYFPHIFYVFLTILFSLIKGVYHLQD